MKCVYCGEFEAVENIPDPNGTDKLWEVCSDCNAVIKEQQKLSFGAMLTSMDNDFSKKYGENLIKEANEMLNEHATRTGVPNLSVVIRKVK